MLRNDRAARVDGVADSQQARYFRGFLSGLRVELEADLAKQVRRLTVAQTSGDVGAIGGLRRTIRKAEGDLGAIARMIHALDSRFPIDAESRVG